MSARALDRAEKKDLLMRRAAKFLDRSFVAKQIIPLVPEASIGALGVFIHRSTPCTNNFAECIV